MNEDNVLGKKFITDIYGKLVDESSLENREVGYKVWGETRRSKNLFLALGIIAIISIIVGIYLDGEITFRTILSFRTVLSLVVTISVLSYGFYFLIYRWHKIKGLTFYPDRICINDGIQDIVLKVGEFKIYKTFSKYGERYTVKHKIGNYTFNPGANLIEYVDKLPYTKDVGLEFIVLSLAIGIALFLLIFWR